MSDTEVFESSRIQAFSDSVIAIAITLLVLEIRPPRDIAAGQLARSLVNLWPSYLAYLTSFTTIGVMWLNHHRLFKMIKHADTTLTSINLSLLLAISWVPFPTAVLATHLRGSDERVAALVYSASFLGIAVLFNILWRYAMRRGRVAATERIHTHWLTYQYAMGVFCYMLLIVIAFISGTACLIISLLLAIYFALPPRIATSVWSRSSRNIPPAVDEVR
jgi:uncharacterized membrane protein